MPRLFLARTAIRLTIISAITATVGCGNLTIPSGPSCTNPNGPGGFTVHISDVNSNGLITGPAAGGRAYGNFASALPNTPLQGCVTSFGSSSGLLSTPWPVQYGEAPSLWSGGSGNECPGLGVSTETRAGCSVGWRSEGRSGRPAYRQNLPVSG
jgi:hypothetical protein